MNSVKDSVVKGKIIRPISGLLAGNHVEDEHNFIGIFPASEGIGVGIIRCRIQSDSGGLTMAGAKCRSSDLCGEYDG